MTGWDARLSFRQQGEILGVGAIGGAGRSLTAFGMTGRVRGCHFDHWEKSWGWVRLAGREDPSLRSG